MRPIQIALATLIFVSVFSRGEEWPFDFENQLGDPMLWTEPGDPKTCPQRLPDAEYTQGLTEELPGARAEDALPDHGAVVVEITPGSAAAQLGVRLEDIFVKLDNIDITSGKQFVDLRKEPHKEVVSHTFGKGNKTLQLPPGLLGVRLGDWKKPPAVVLQAPADARWNREVETARLLIRRSPKLAEAAICRALAAGCPVTLAASAVKYAVEARSHPMAMELCYFALRTDKPDPTLVNTFVNAAIASYKLEAALQFIRKYSGQFPDYPVAELERLIKAHKALPERERAWAMHLEYPKLHADPLLQRIRPVEQVNQDQQQNIKNLGDHGALPVGLATGGKECITFLPEAVDMSLSCYFIFPDAKEGAKDKNFCIGVVDMAADEKLAGNARPSRSGNLQHTLGAVFSPESVSITSWAKPLCFQANYGRFNLMPGMRHSFSMIIWHGRVAITVDDKQLFYGPLDLEKPRLAVTFAARGVSALVMDLRLNELTDVEGGKARLAATVNDPGLNGRTRLHIAAALAGTAEVKTLLDAGADPNLLDDNLETPLHTALRRGWSENVKLLLKQGAKPDVLCSAVLGDKSSVEQLLAKQPELLRTSMPWSLLHGAVRSGNVELAKFVLEKGADVNVQTPTVFGLQTPLHWAIMGADKPMVELLLARGADVKKINRYSFTPLWLAEAKDLRDIAEILRPKAAPSPKPVKPPPPPDLEF